MKKLNRREKIIVRLMLLVALAVGLVELSDAYFKAKQKLTEDNDQLRASIATLVERLEKESADQYTEQTEVIEKDLVEARERVLGLPNENDASVFFSKVITENAESAGLNVNAISNRKSTEVNPELGLIELHTYFGYDCDLGALLNFFEMLDAQNFYVSIESLTITQRNVLPRGLKSRRIERVERKPMNGSAILTTLFRPDPEGKQDKYERKVEPKKLEVVKIVEAKPIRQDVAPTEEAKTDPIIRRPRDSNRPQLPTRNRPTRTLFGGEPQKGNVPGPVRVAPPTKQENPKEEDRDNDYDEESQMETGLKEDSSVEAPVDENGQPIVEPVIPKNDAPPGNGPSQWPGTQNPRPKPPKLDNRPRPLSHTSAPAKPAGSVNQ